MTFHGRSSGTSSIPLFIDLETFGEVPNVCARLRGCVENNDLSARLKLARVTKNMETSGGCIVRGAQGLARMPSRARWRSHEV